MNHPAERPDVARIESGLKDFQRATVDYVFRRLYTDPQPTRRFLIADEVGLGKTLVARGVIARAIDHLWDRVDRIDVVYICSNADIARQNINRLNVTGQDGFALASRITLLPLQYHELTQRKLNFISFTPGTSFELKSNLGRRSERVLLYLLLERGWGLRGRAPLNVLSGNMYAENFRWWVKESQHERIDSQLANAFLAALDKRIADQSAQGKEDLRTRFERLCSSFNRSDSRINDNDWRERTAWVGEVRSLLAQTCLGQLQPDLIILDEFQRFKNLLARKDEASELAHELFDYADAQTRARVILLSATPYKMYTMAHEEGEDHYRDFLETMRFLLDDGDKHRNLEGILEAYRDAILGADDPAGGRLLDARRQLEASLRQVMVRTERLASTVDRSGMLAEETSGIELNKEDVLSYLALEGLQGLHNGTSLEYWKSASYLLNFMEDYDLKRGFQAALEDPLRAREIGEKLLSHPGLLLPWRRNIQKYRPVEPRNPRLRALQTETLERGSWKLLWIPPSLPYYSMEGPYADSALDGLTKRIVFSSWKVVPRVVASLLSYEAERQMIVSLDPAATNTADGREKRRPLLRFARAEGRLTGLPLFSLIYPCVTLARDFDPLDYPGPWRQTARLPSAQELAEAMAPGLSSLLATIVADAATEGAEDERWYWLAPILLDLGNDKIRTSEWWRQEGLASEWAAKDEGADEEEGASAWGEHVNHVRELAAQIARGDAQLGPAPADLEGFLANVAMAGPGVVMLRSLSRPLGDRASLSHLGTRNAAATVARSFLGLFNIPEATHMIRGLNAEEPFWHRVLEYCIAGGLQPVMDEYVHILQESLGLVGGITEKTIPDVADAVVEALTLRTSTPSVDEIYVGPKTGRVDIYQQRMRNRFAVRFGDERAEGTSQPTRSDQVRAAFNSPFWPLVLVTTSVGQEGLDFHPYCHIVVHWNLPSNPVDLEQREGRVHRYKGHAVRKNLAARFGLHQALSAMGTDRDVWNALFRLGVSHRDGASDIVPFWVFKMDGGAVIERHIPMLPLSRDIERAEALRRSLAVYRMVFGQPRQEDLITYILARVPKERLGEVSDALRIDLSPPSRA